MIFPRAEGCWSFSQIPRTQVFQLRFGWQFPAHVYIFYELYTQTNTSLNAYIYSLTTSVRGAKIRVSVGLRLDM